MRHKYKKEVLLNAVANSTSWAEVCRRLGVKPMTGSQTYLKKKAIAFGAYDSHFTGSAHNKGKTWMVAKAETYLFNGSIINSHRLKGYLFREKIKEERCERCGISEWMGESVVLELDHIDNDHYNNELVNLMILCPNCHAAKTRKTRLAKQVNADALEA